MGIPCKKYLKILKESYESYLAIVAEWAKALPQIQVEVHPRSQVRIPLGTFIDRIRLKPLTFQVTYFHFQQNLPTEMRVT